MTAVQYTARRSLVPGHTDGTTYDLDVRLSRIDGSDKRIGESHKSLSGKRMYIHHRVDETISCSSIALNETDKNLYQEFLKSVNAGEQFLFDELGSVASPDNPVLATLASKSNYTIQRINISPDLFRVSFSVELV
jgi:hypothetical protein